MKFKLMIGAAALLALGACANMAGDDTPAPAFNAAACTQRDFVIYFEEGSFEITPEARRIIALEARGIDGCRIDSVRILGLSDFDEGATSARRLSEDRAENLADYLRDNERWPTSRFEVLAGGSNGATTPEGLDVPVRNRARIVVATHAP